VEDSRLVRITKIALGFPEATREICGRHSSFVVRKRTFAYFLDDHHGDGIVSIASKVLPGDNDRLASVEPQRFYKPAYVGPRGWVALRLDQGPIDWEEVTELLRGSYLLVAPKGLRKIALV
jgi:phosphoribosylglycinamide formyltransferase-1